MQIQFVLTDTEKFWLHPTNLIQNLHKYLLCFEKARIITVSGASRVIWEVSFVNIYSIN